MRSSASRRANGSTHGSRRVSSIVFAFVLSACTPPEPDIDLPAAPLLSSRNDYALVVAPLARVFATATYDADVVGHVTGGTIVDVLALGAAGRWIRVESGATTGWIDADAGMVFDRFGAAQDAARRILAPRDPAATQP